MKKLLITTALLLTTLITTTANATCYGGCNWVGPQGPQGPQGEQGPAGANGVDGVDGVDGKDGLDGLDGTRGVSGIDGLDGRDSGFTGLSAAIAAGSIKDRGIAAAVSGGGGQFEYSLVGGYSLEELDLEDVKAFAAITRNRYDQTRVSGGVAWNF